MVYADGRWVAVGYGPNTILTSTDGINWTTVSGTTFRFVGYNVTYANGRWVGLGLAPSSGNNNILISPSS